MIASPPLDPHLSFILKPHFRGESDLRSPSSVKGVFYREDRSMKQMYDIIHPRFGAERNLNPIIFLHGMFLDRKCWKKVGPLIAQKTGRKAYMLDARNHGESPSSEEMNYDVLVQDVLEFMDEHNIERAVILGHSMGGRTAINFALKYPGRTEALVVENMTPKNVSSGATSFVQIAVDAFKGYLKSLLPDYNLDVAKRKFLKRCLEMAVEFQKLEDAEKVYKNCDLDMIPIVKIEDSFAPVCNLDAIILMLKSNAHIQDLPDKNLKFNGDALFLYGDLGFFNLERDTTIRKLFPSATVKKIQGACHVIHVEYPDVYAEVVSHFINHRNCHEAKL